MKSQIAAWIATAIGVGSGVFAWVKLHRSGIFKYISVGMDIGNIVRASVEASDDDKISPAEVDQIIALANKLKQDLKQGASK